MDERGWWSRALAVLGALVSFRVAVAMSTSVGVTAAVAGPMALEAYRVRHPEREAAAESPARPDPSAPTAAPTRPTSTTTTTSTTTSTTTTSPDAVPVTAPGRVVTTTTTAASSSSTPSTTAAPRIGPDGLAAGVRDDRADAVALEGAVVTGRVYVYAVVDGATTVRFWVDDPAGAGAPARTDSAAPFDLGDPLVDTTALGAGQHTLLAEVDTPGGTLRRLATFRVR